MIELLRASFVGTSLAAVSLLGVAGCGDDGSSTRTDAGVDPDEGDAATPPDTTGPRLLETSPADGSEAVAPSTAFEAVFSEPMRADVGTLRVRVEGEEVAVDASLEEETRLTFAVPGGTWPAASEIEVRIGADFEDLAGNPLERPYVVRFTTADDVPPTVESTDPAEGAGDVSTRLGAIRIRFSKPMDQAAGTVTLEGGAGEIDADSPAWSPFEVSYAVRGLEHGASYRVVLSGFADRTGNALDGAATLEDGALDFTTRADDEPPRVVRSTPVEGQVDVLVEHLGGAIEVELDEPMDTTVETAPLTVDGETTDVAVTWLDDRTARFAIGGVARTEAEHSLDLRGLTDAAGNPLAEEPYLGDGRLDFQTGVDAFVPYVAASTPEEGATGVPIPLGEVLLAFSEAMDGTVADVTVTDDLARTTTVTGTWRAGGTVLALPGSAFVPGRTIQVDVTGLRDLAGTPVSDVHPYLGDGRLDFSLAPPTGSSCADPILLEHADSVDMGRYHFDITRAQRTRNNGSASCDPDGPSETDAVILYRKTTPALGDPSGDGRALRILTFDVSNRANIEVFAGVCDPRDPAADPARRVCVTGHASWDQLLDVPAGDYYIWVSTADGSPFDIDVAVEEVAAMPEGEACADPYDVSSAGYTPPGGPGEPHVWDLPSGPNNSVDVAPSNGPYEAISCREEPFGDVVVALDKAEDDTVLDIRVQSGGFGVSAEVVTGACRGSDPAATRAGCIPFASSTAPRRMTAAGPAGPTHIWLAGTASGSAFPGARLEVREIPAPTAAGSSCATAIPITPGASVAITPDHAERYYAPSCIPTDSNVTWYAFDTTERLTHVRTLGAGAVGLLDAATDRERDCRTDGTTEPVVFFAPAGTRVCVAVESGSAVTGLAVEGIAYGGVGVGAPVPLDIDPPSLEGSIASSILGDTWLALTPTTLWQNIGTAGIFSAPRTGGVQARARFDVDGRVLGDGAVAIGEALYTLDLSASGSRLFRLTDASGAWAPVAWDPGASYARNTRALTFDDAALYTVDNLTSSSATRESAIYRIPHGAPGAPTVIGTVDTIYSIDRMAADGTWFYLAGQESTSSSTAGVWRVRRADLADGVVTSPELLGHLGQISALAVDDRADAAYLYVRTSDGDIHVIGAPGSASPGWLGVLFDGDSGDNAMDYDPATGTLVFFSTHEEPAGEWYRFGP